MRDAFFAGAQSQWATINELVAMLKEVDDEANNRQLDIHKLLRRHRLST